MNTDKKKLRWQPNSDAVAYLLLFTISSFPVVYSLMLGKHLSGDGTLYFTSILDTGNFTYFAWSRKFANLLTEWPVVLAVKLQVKTIPSLINLYGIGIYSPYVLSFLICIYAVRKEHSSLLTFPLLSILGINLSGDYLLFGEHHVMVLLSWPILLLLLRRESLDWLDGLLLWTLLLLFSRTYESAIIPATIFSLILLAKTYAARKHRKLLSVYSISLALSLSTILIGLYFIVNPRDPANKLSFISGIINGLLGNGGALVTASFACLSTMGLILGKKAIALASLIPLIIYIFFALLNGHGHTAYESFTSRTLTSSLLPFLLVCAICHRGYNANPSGNSAKILIVIVVSMALVNLHFARDWINLRKQVIDILTANHGYISLEKTSVKDSPYRWYWNNPGLGIIWSYPCVKSILLNTPDTKWEPFNPRKKLILKEYIGYDIFFRGADKRTRICR